VSRGFARQAIAELRIGNEIVATRKAVADYQRPKPAPQVAADPDKVYQVAVGNAPVIGPSNAQVTAIAFLDYQ
jgi:protein-disulfide isomerase